MAVICHSQGNIATDGCCYVAGAPCPLRWKIVNGRVLQGSNLTDIGTVAQAVNARWSGSQARARVNAQLTGLLVACRAALDSFASDSRTVTDRARLNAAWDANTDYLNQVRPHWAAVEQANGWAAGSYQCSTWKGAGSGECCFGESAAVNLAKQAAMSATAVTIRTAGLALARVTGA